MAKFLLALLVWDDEGVNWSGKTRWVIGWIIGILCFLILLWNTLVLLWRLFDHKSKCSALAAGGVVPTPLNMINNTNMMRVDDDEEVI